MSNLPKTKKIAITGSMASGKSSVSDYLRNLGYAVFDADATVHELYECDETLKQEMIAHFGKEILHNNRISTTRLRDILTACPNQKEIVEQLVHPRVLAQWLQFSASKPDHLVFAEVPLLFEVGWEPYFDEIWFVYADAHVVLDRLKKNRNLDQETIKTMLKWQMDPQKKCAKSTFVLYNNTEIKSLHDQIDQRLKIR